MNDLKSANSIKSGQVLRAGAYLMVPTRAGASRPAAARPATTSAALNGSYRVKPGDTLGKIAGRFSVSVASLQNANGLRSPQDLRAGAILKVPTTPSAGDGTPAKAVTQSINQTKGMTVAAKPPVRRHQVKSGETLSSIAALYGVKAEEIQKLNAIRSPKSLQVGSWLKIPSAATEVLASAKTGLP